MSATVVKTYTEPPVCEKEVLRYAGCKKANGEILSLLHSCLEEMRGKLVYRICYREFFLRITGDVCDFGDFRLRSKHLSRNLSGCEKAIVFAATVGMETNRLIEKYGRLSPSRALMIQAIGTERIETLCNVFCKDIEREKQVWTKPRFSAGYGDLSLDTQKEIFEVLDCSKKIGVYLNESLLMSPSKSVTAFVGLSREKKETVPTCAACQQKDCAFRGEL